MLRSRPGTLPTLMSEHDQDQVPGGGIRRVTRDQRRKRVEPRQPLFPVDEPTADEFAPKRTDSADVPVSGERFPPTKHDAEESAATQPPSAGRSSGNAAAWQNAVAVFFFIATLVVAAIYTMIAIDPYTPLNPLAPPTPLPIIITTTPLPGADLPQATITPQPSETFTPIPVVVFTPTFVTPPERFPFSLGGAVRYIANPGTDGCNWSSIAGQVFDLNNQPLPGYGVRVAGADLDVQVAAGSAVTFGASGYEVPLNGVPTASTFRVQLLSPEGTPLSETYTVETRATCEEAVAVVDFIQNREL